MSPNDFYLIAATAGVAAVVAAPVLWRWCRDAQDDYPTHPRNKEAFAALNLRAANFRRLQEWRNRAANAKAALELELKRKRGGIGQARKAYEDAVSQVLMLESGKRPYTSLLEDPDTQRAMLTASVGSSPSDPD